MFTKKTKPPGGRHENEKIWHLKMFQDDDDDDDGDVLSLKKN